jgi:uncharacterized membrane-anchored protein
MSKAERVLKRNWAITAINDRKSESELWEAIIATNVLAVGDGMGQMALSGLINGSKEGFEGA